MATSYDNVSNYSCVWVVVLLIVSLTLANGDMLDRYRTEIYRCPSRLHNSRYTFVHRELCYEFVTSERDWIDANSYCSRQGGRLITITRRDIQIFVEHVLSRLWHKNGMWIGAHDRHDEEDWRWVTGQRVNSGFQNWASGQPSCHLLEFLCFEDCGCLRKNDRYLWHDYLCGSDAYNYGFSCEYGLSAPSTTKQTTTPPTTTTTSTTTMSTTTTSTTKSPTRPSTANTSSSASSTPGVKVSMEPWKPSYHHVTADLQMKNATNDSNIHGGNLIDVKTNKLIAKDDEMGTGGVVGLVVSFVLVFIVGLCIGVFMCRRRRKQYEESASLGFNNVLYTAAPARCPTRVKDTNVVAAVGGGDTSDEEEDHKYVDIDEISPCAAKRVDLPTYSDIEQCSSQNKVCQVSVEAESDAIEDGACGDAPPPCPGRDMIGVFAPEFLKKETDVSQAYSNNLYGYHK